ncbi:hypothetical protein T492DRAFT_1046125 [Pavlovales sp. CCMP2436]|nr:hypothetical protein T492DRAFT_1046125 [Pavlovales sp. CCMP2436]
MHGVVSAFGTDYDAVAAWAEGRLPALEPNSAEDAHKLAVAALPAPAARARKLPPYLHRSEASRLVHRSEASWLAHYELGADPSQHLDRSRIQTDPTSHSGLKRAAREARKVFLAEQELSHVPVRRMFGSAASSFSAGWETRGPHDPRPLPSQQSMTMRRLLIAKKRYDPRHKQPTGFRRTPDGWGFQQGEWSLSVSASDPLLSNLLDERLRSPLEFKGGGSSRFEGSGSDNVGSREADRIRATHTESHAQLAARLAPANLGAKTGVAQAAGPPEWLARFHLQLEGEARKDDEARRVAPAVEEERLAALRSAAVEAGLAKVGGAQFTDEELVWRERVRASSWLQLLLASALGHFDVNGDGALDLKEYLVMSKQVYAVLHSHYEDAEAERVAHADWQWYASFILAVLLQISMAPRRGPAAQLKTFRTAPVAHSATDPQATLRPYLKARPAAALALRAQASLPVRVPQLATDWRGGSRDFKQEEALGDEGSSYGPWKNPSALLNGDSKKGFASHAFVSAPLGRPGSRPLSQGVGHSPTSPPGFERSSLSPSASFVSLAPPFSSSSYYSSLGTATSTSALGGARMARNWTSLEGYHRMPPPKLSTRSAVG